MLEALEAEALQTMQERCLPRAVKDITINFKSPVTAVTALPVSLKSW